MSFIYHAKEDMILMNCNIDILSIDANYSYISPYCGIHGDITFEIDKKWNFEWEILNLDICNCMTSISVFHVLLNIFGFMEKQMKADTGIIHISFFGDI